MLRKNRMIIFIVLMLMMTSNAYSAASYQKSDHNKVTKWNKVTDYFATIGKEGREKRKILRKRKYARKNKRIQKARDKAKKEQIKKNKKLRSSYISQ